MANRKSTPVQSRRGSALLLVLVVTVLLSVIGILFVMVTRLREITSSNVADSRDLDGGIEAVVGQINKTLKNDVIAAINGTELYDSTSSDDSWLASLEPSSQLPDVKNEPVNTDIDPTNDWYQWEQVTNLTGAASQWDFILRNGKKTDDATGNLWDITKGEFGGIVEDYQLFTVTTAGKTVPMTSAQIEGLPADADGDGVADSIWMKLPNLSSSRGQPIFAAVRIIDNCAMLNLNTAYCFYQAPFVPATPVSPFDKFWQLRDTLGPYLGTIFSSNSPYGDGGRYLSEINYLPFLRGRDLNGYFGNTSGDGWYQLLEAKNFCKVNSGNSYHLDSQLSVDQVHDNVLMNIENPGAAYSLFDIGDELELRNRFLLTSRAESRIERKDVANYTLDSGGGVYAALEVPRDSTTDADNIPNFTKWKWRIDPNNFDLWTGAFKGTWVGNNLDNSYKYDRRHVCTFYSFDRNLRSGSYPKIKAAMGLLPTTFSESKIKAIDAFFRPENNQPINLRWITTPANPVIATDPKNPNNITANTPEARRNILHLLYAFREYYYYTYVNMGYSLNKALSVSAQKSAQIVANMIDYLDDNSVVASGPFADAMYGAQVNVNPTYINRSIVRQMILELCQNYNSSNPADPITNAEMTLAKLDIGATPTAPLSPFEFGLGLSDTASPPVAETVYGYERQPFMSELYVRLADGGAVDAFAVEIANLYDDTRDVSNWKLVIEDANGNSVEPPLAPLPSNTVIPAGTVSNPSYLVLKSLAGVPSSGNSVIVNLLTSFKNVSAHRLSLKRIDPATNNAEITVDQFYLNAIRPLLTDLNDGLPTHHFFKRQDGSWKICDPNGPLHSSIAQAGYPAGMTLGTANGVTTSGKERQLPVADANNPIYTWGDFQKIVFVGNQYGVNEPNSITGFIAQSSSEGEIRFDPVSDSGMMRYFCTLNRDKEGNLPGRININTAPVHVIAAAIPPSLVYAYPNDPNTSLEIARQIVADRPYTSISDLIDSATKPGIAKLLQKYSNDPKVVGGVGDASIRGDFEEQDWIFNRLANIFSVRSDTFTAYILVRLGTDGPQRRMIAIFDRSNVWSNEDKPKLVALHPVPDPR